MAKLGLQAAAELTGRSRSTIHRAMQQGRLSYERDESGARLVDTAELLRVFGDPPPEDARNRVSDGERHAMHSAELRAKLDLERAKNALIEERIAELKEERDRWREQASRLLTDQRPARRRRWWPWRPHVAALPPLPALTQPVPPCLAECGLSKPCIVFTLSRRRAVEVSTGWD